MRRHEVLWVVVAVAIVTIGCSEREAAKPPSAEQASGRSGAVGTGGAGANLSDDEFVRDVALKNMAEIELSRLAVDKATRPDIRSFAQQMIDDHGQAGHGLKSITSGQPNEWPTQLDEKHRKSVDELVKKQGADFDGDYIKRMVEGHQDLAAKLESRLDVQSLAAWKTAAAGRTDSKALPEPSVWMRDVQVRPSKSGNELTMKINQWAADTYPIAQKHLDTARALETATNKR
jgi:putative membrane protein